LDAHKANSSARHDAVPADKWKQGLQTGGVAGELIAHLSAIERTILAAPTTPAKAS